MWVSRGKCLICDMSPFPFGNVGKVLYSPNGNYNSW